MKLNNSKEDDQPFVKFKKIYHDLHPDNPWYKNSYN